MLDALNKQVKTETVYKTIRNCKKHKILVSGSFIVGHPDETRDDVEQTREMIRKLRLDSIGVAIATPFPRTRWWEIAQERHLIPQKIDWEDFNFDKVPIKLNQEFSEAELKNLQRTYYWDSLRANPRYIFKIIKAFMVGKN